MKAKKQKNGIKVLLSLVIAIAMIGIPASVFTAAETTDGTVATTYNDSVSPAPPVAADPYGTVTLLSEGFESWSPASWTVGTNWSQNTTVNHTGAACAMHNETPGPSLLSTPSIDATGLNTVTLTYYARTDSYNDLNGTVEVGGTVVGYCNISAANRGTWILFTVDLSAYDDSIFTIDFNYSDPSNDAQWLLDDVVVTADNHPAGIDIAVNGLPNINCGGRNNTVPRTIYADVANYGLTNATNVGFHLQIYQEVPLALEQYKLWDMESCVLKTWDVESYDAGNPWSTWTWTEKRANSPTHSWHTQPDSLATYEAYSNDSLILHDWFHVNSTVDGKDVSIAYLTFAHWCEGEFDGTNPIDYGTIYIINATGKYEVGGPYYDTGGEWEVLTGTDGIDISDWIGQDIKIEFNWIADATGNYEGWYIDDVNIDYSYTSLQPLIFQGYKYVDLNGTEEKTIGFPIDWQPPAPGTYYIQVYASDNFMPDVNLSNNDYNCTVWFGDVCDAAVTAITAPDDVILDHSVGYVEIPINVTVYNNGTLAEDIPVTVSAQHKLTNIIAEDDVEGGILDEWGTPGMWVAGEALYEDVWTITDQDYFSPTHSWYTEPRTAGIGQAKLWEAIDPDVPGGLKWTSNIKWNLPAGASAVPVFLATTYYWDLGEYIDPAHYRENPFTGASGWTSFDVDEYIKTHTLYWEHNDFWGGFGELDSFAELLTNLNTRYGYVEDFSSIKIGFLLEAPSGLGAGEGFWFDDFKLFNEYAGATVWSDTKTITLNPGETGYLEYTWNATEYCDYILTANVALDCDVDPNNNEVQTSTRIHEWQYVDDYEKVAFDDNTCGLPDDWHIVEECSICPDDSFWWNGVDDLGTYEENRNDTLQIKEEFNFTNMTVTEAYLNFSVYYLMELDYDYGYVEVSNDSGVTWFLLDTLNNISGGWVDVSEHLLPGTTVLHSDYTGMDFTMPGTFFTENMLFRFRFYSDAATNWKGWYIDDVNLTIFNGTWNTIFFDDMENGDALWTHGYICYGNHWHNETVFGAPYPSADATAWWNGEHRTWIGSGTVASYGRGLTPFNSMAWSGIGGYYWFGDGDGGYYDGGAPGGVGSYQTTLDGSLWGAPISLDLTYWQLNFISGASGITANVDVWDGTTSISTPLPNTGIGMNNTVTVDISAMAGSPVVNIAINVTNTIGFDWMGLTTMYINASGPTIPGDLYYNDVDEKVIFSYDLMHAYEAILHFSQNYSFADENDIGQVEIWTGSAWQPIFVAKGSSDWSEVTVDITKYVLHDAMTMIRFRFISDHTGQSYGWLVDNVSIDGKVDYKAPTISSSLSPATPDGNNGWYKSDVTVTLTASDNVKVGNIYYRIDGGSWLTYTAPFTIGIEGQHTVDYYAVDSVGNEGAHGSVSFKIDKTAPTASISTPQAGYIYFFGRELMPRILFKDKALIIGGLLAEATASDAMSGVYVVKFNEDGTTFAEDTSSPYSAPLPFALFAAHTLTVTAEDFAGNTYTSPGVDYFKVF